MNTTDQNIIDLIDLWVYENKYSSARDFCLKNNILEQTFSKIKKGTNHFTVAQIEKICLKHDVNFNFVFGVEKEKYRKTKNKK